MFPSPHGPLTPEERFVQSWMIVTVLVSGAIFAGMVFGLWTWRIHSFPHAVATITEVWQMQVQVHRGSGRGAWLEDLVMEPKYRTVTMGRIQFTRAHKGKMYDCSIAVDLGVPSDDYQVGQKLEIVPATGTCQRVDILGRMMP